MESIEKMESDFKNCHVFLVTILNKAVCRGSFPHCEYARENPAALPLSRAKAACCLTRNGISPLSQLEGPSAAVPRLDCFFRITLGGVNIKM